MQAGAAAQVTPVQAAHSCRSSTASPWGQPGLDAAKPSTERVSAIQSMRVCCAGGPELDVRRGSASVFSSAALCAFHAALCQL